MQSGRFGFRRVHVGTGMSRWVVHTAEIYPGAPSSAGRRPSYRVAGLALEQEDPHTLSGLLLLYADLPEEATAQLLKDLAYMLVSPDGALYLDVVRAIDLGAHELLGDVRRAAMQDIEQVADADDRRYDRTPPRAASDVPLH
ncbi:MAG TPA: hypothetical protein VFY20_10660 [Gemmatimonadales bacterium]|nr:hypothetical protein [Gemmatimonadales bacterium]